MNMVKVDLTTARDVSIRSRVILVALNVSQWTARKLDKRATAQVAEMNGASARAGTYRKALIAKGALAKIAEIAGQARTDHADMSLPWMQDGTRIIPVDLWGRYTARMAGHRERFESAVREFIAGYDELVAEAQDELGSLFNRGDYPHKDTLAQRFAWRITCLPMPDAADFRLDLDKATVAALQADLQSEVNQALHSAIGDAAGRLHDVARAMAEKLAAYNPSLGKQGNPFRDSLVGNVRELLDVLPALNMTGDARLASAIDAAQSKLAKHDAQALREDATLRSEIADEAKRIADDLAAWMI